MKDKTQKSKYLNYEDAKLKMEKYCIYQDRCHFDVEKKLFTLGLNSDIKNQIIIDLIQNDFLNEERFAKSFVQGRFNQKKWGKTKIKFELKKRNIHDNLINKALKEIDLEEYYQTLRLLYIKKYKSVKDKKTSVKKKKTISYLLNKGYEYQSIYEAIKDFEND
jgi:regulatory protein